MNYYFPMDPKLMDIQNLKNVVFNSEEWQLWMESSFEGFFDTEGFDKFKSMPLLNKCKMLYLMGEHFAVKNDPIRYDYCIKERDKYVKIFLQKLYQHQSNVQNTRK